VRATQDRGHLENTMSDLKARLQFVNISTLGGDKYEFKKEKVVI
jgi:hypothetical protein